MSNILLVFIALIIFSYLLKECNTFKQAIVTTLFVWSIGAIVYSLVLL